MKVPFADLNRMHAPIRSDMEAAIKKVIDANAYILGPEVEAFEREFATYCRPKTSPGFAAGVSNGLDGLELALRACNIGERDQVIVPANTFNASAAAIASIGAIPVLVDCDPVTKLMDASNLDGLLAAIPDAAIMPVHLYGQQVDMEAIWAKAQGHVIVEDACQAHGSLRNGYGPSTYSHAAVFSFYPGKNLGALGDAGAVVSDNSNLINEIKQIRNYGQKVKYNHDVLGSNKRLDGLQAAILRVKLPYLDSWNESRRQSASKLIERLDGVGDLKLPVTLPGNTHNYHLFVVETEKRDELAQYLKEKGVDTGIHYPVPIHLQPAFSYLGYKEGDFPNAEAASRRILSLPMFPFMKDDEIEYVADKVREFYKN